ncbi:hypothetical protein VB776_16160 [Arcicella sp. DC2W]|uniref:Uncharacterized protein n=1 Tax=Arcicella gelida TaxID=2984195 RepID=A0ABU5S7L7_9BACT|nr:hypothetical protein [Arcicella sp. DC2W]MEA5404467.1 hypothetical protein [Arcicella sp. DC2W]
MNSIGKRLRQLIENQYETINNFAVQTDNERGQIYFDIKNDDVHTKRLRIYLPALGMTFSEFFKDIEDDASVFESKNLKAVGKSNNEISTLKAYYESLLKEKERTIETQKELIEVLKGKNNQ